MSIKRKNPKPIALANKRFPYNDIADDRRFEDLLFAIVSCKINGNGFYQYDDASLMPGVGEKGRDITLYKGGKICGVIQCKKHIKNISLNELGEDLTKYILHSLIDNELIPDKANFTYYIATSTGLTTDCSDFVDQFSVKSIDSKKIVEWVEKNCRKYKGLEIFHQGSEVISKVLEICSNIKVKKITPSHLDIFLSETDCENIIPSFFEVRTIYSKTKQSELDESQIKIELQRCSATLSIVKNHFGELKNSHISRSETFEILAWINNELQLDKNGKPLNTFLLVGDAGSGKTIVLKDLYDLLVLDNIPVLAIKADRVYAENLNALQNEMGLSIPVFDFVERCKQKFSKLIIIIDQIDALSQSLSSNRSYLNTLNRLIDTYTFDENIRLIISARNFDLDYDPSLKVYKDTKKVVSKELKDEDVISVLNKLSINKNEISEKLFQLLKVPNNLSIFSSIVACNKSYYSIESLIDLYFELWKQKIIDIPIGQPLDSIGLKSILYSIVDQMYKEQRLSLNEVRFEDYNKELSFLESNGIIQRKNGWINFFHQTFFDFLFAKKFVEQGKNLIEYIEENQQSLHIRSSLKMILDYLRIFNPQKYYANISTLLKDSNILFHLKHLVVSLLAFLKSPDEKEARIAIDAISQSPQLKVIFFEKITSGDWLKVLIENNILDFLKSEDAFTTTSSEAGENSISRKYLVGYASGLLTRFILRGDDSAWALIFDIKNEDILRNTLYSITDWSDSRAYRLFELSSGRLRKDQFAYIHILTNIAKINPEYSLKEGIGLLLTIENDTLLNYGEKQLLKDWATTIPEQLISPLFNKIQQKINDVYKINSDVLEDIAFNGVDLFEDDTHGDGFFYQLLALCLKRSAKNEAPQFRSFLLQHTFSNSNSILRLLIFAFKGNEQVYKNEIFRLFCYFDERNLLNIYGRLNFEFRLIFEKAVLYFAKSQIADVRNKLKNIIVKDEVYCYQIPNNKKYLVSYWGKTKYSYLLRLPISYLQDDHVLWKQFLELQRRYPSFKDTSRSNSTIAHVVGSPLPSNAYEKMGNKHWVKSFLTYSSDKTDWKDGVPKGGVIEHSRAFESVVKSNPSKEKIDLIKEIIPNKDVNRIYPIAGLSALVEAKADASLITDIFRSILDTGGFDNELRPLISVARYLVGFDNVDICVVDFLISSAKLEMESTIIVSEPEKKTSDQGLIMSGLNSIPGAAANALTYTSDKKYSPMIFQSLREIVMKASKSTKAITLWQFAYLLNLNQAMAFVLFKDLVDQEDDVYVLASSIWSLQYMVSHNFESFVPTLEKLSDSPDIGDEDGKGLFNILYFSHLRSRPHATELLLQFLVRNPNIYLYAFRTITKYLYESKESLERAPEVLSGILNNAINANEKINFGFYEMDHVDLLYIMPFLETYMDSKIFEISQNLISYLYSQCKNYPNAAIKLFSKIIVKETFELDRNLYSRCYEEITRFIIGAYNSLEINGRENQEMRSHLLFLFDKLLLDFEMRGRSEKILEKADFISFE